MDRQTPVNPNGSAESAGRHVIENAADLWHHILLLGELQARLLCVEVGEGFRTARAGVTLVVCGILLVVATVPLLLAALALMLMETANFTPANAFGIVAGAAMAIAIAICAAGCLYLRQQTLGAPRSRAEWFMNWNWLKDTLRRGRGSRARMPSARAPQ